MTESELLMPFCCEYTQKLFDDVRFFCGGKWLMMKVTDSEILEDVKKLVALRVPPKRVV